MKIRILTKYFVIQKRLHTFEEEHIKKSTKYTQ